MQLTDEPEKRCYPLGDRLFCRNCHITNAKTLGYTLANEVSFQIFILQDYFFQPFSTIFSTIIIFYRVLE